jgi:polysaccharide biosynthesis protein PslG
LLRYFSIKFNIMKQEKQKHYEWLTFLICLSLITAATYFIFSDNKVKIVHTSPSITSDAQSPNVGGNNFITDKLTEAAPQNALADKFGLSLSTTLYEMSDTELTAQFDDLNYLGVSWARFDLGWDIVQPDNAQNYNWEPVDRIIKVANLHHIKLLALLSYTPKWARSAKCPNSDKCLPADPAQFAAFARQAAVRYTALGINDWEIWNEPNIEDFWQPAPSPIDYANLLKAVYPAIKSVASSSVVITGGLAPVAVNIKLDITSTNFLTDLYQAGAGKYFDAVAMHPYCYPALPLTDRGGNGWMQMEINPVNLRSIMDRNGDIKKQIWLTEFGAPTNGPGGEATLDNYQTNKQADHVNEDLQAEIISEGVKIAQTYSWAGPLFIYSYKDQGVSKKTNEDFFGLVRHDNTLKPAYNILKKLLTSPLPCKKSAAAGNIPFMNY